MSWRTSAVKHTCHSKASAAEAEIGRARAIAGGNVQPRSDLYLMERTGAQLKSNRKIQGTGGIHV